jgi:hypothetical protein
MNYFYLIIITKEQIKISSNLDLLYINDNFTLLDDHHILYNNETYEFEYLIYSNLIDVVYNKEYMILREDNIPITNFYYQTSIDNIYYITEDNLINKINEIIENE